MTHGEGAGGTGPWLNIGGMLPPIPCMFDGVRYSPLIRVRRLPPEPYEIVTTYHTAF